MPAFLGRAIYYTPGDHKNLNRVFPGRADGTISERIAFAITREFIERTQYLLDLHCGDANESLRPYLYWTINAAPPLVENIRQLAAAFGMDHVILDNGRPTDPAASVYLENTAITRGKPALTIESGGMGQSDEESIARIERGVAGVLKHLKMRATGPDPVEHIVFLGRNQVLTSQHTGIFYPLVDKGTTVAEGALIGRITDFHGKTVEEVRAPFTGEILYVIGTPPTSKGEPLGFIAAPAKPDEFPKK
jgi:predicted deacylase